MDWINCNSCFIQPGNGKKFHLTSCGHIYCDLCVIERTKDNCFMCNLKCTTFQLSNQMNQNIDLFFYDFSEIMKQFRKSILESVDQKLEKLDKVYSFQSSHRLHLQKHLLDISSKQQDLEQKLKFMFEKTKQLEDENSFLKNTISNLKANQADNDMKRFNFNDDLSIPQINHNKSNTNIFSGNFRNNFEPFSKPIDVKTNFQNSTDRDTSISSCNIRSLFNTPSSHSISSSHSKLGSDIHNFYDHSNNNNLTSTSNKPYVKNISNQSIRDIIISLSQKQSK